MNKPIKDFTVIDLETSGFYPNNRIIEFGAVRFRDGKPIDTFQQYAKYQGKLPDAVKNLTGITEELLKEKGIHKDEAYNKMIDFIGDDILVAHNMEFDWGFLEYHNPMCKETGEPIYELNNKKHCTLKIARKLKLNVKNNKLETLCNYYNITPERYHSAVCDAQATGELFLKLQEDTNYKNEPIKVNSSNTNSTNNNPIFTIEYTIKETVSYDDNTSSKKAPQKFETPNFKNAKMPKNISTGLLGIFLGCFGIHNYVYGYYIKGSIQLAITILSAGYLAFIPAIWALVESVLIMINKIQPSTGDTEKIKKLINKFKNK